MIIIKGYYFIYLPNYKHSQINGYIRIHRLIYSLLLGRPLKRTEIVHHIDGNKLNNKIENLKLLNSNSEHYYKHFNKIKQNKRICFNCKSNKTYMVKRNFGLYPNWHNINNNNVLCHKCFMRNKMRVTKNINNTKYRTLPIIIS